MPPARNDWWRRLVEAGVEDVLAMKVVRIAEGRGSVMKRIKKPKRCAEFASNEGNVPS
jgi:hypothetical protein